MKLPIDTIAAMIGRMTPREKRLFGILAVSLLAVVAGGVYLASAAVFGAIQDEIDHDRQVLGELRALAPRYMELSEIRRQTEEAIRNNRTSVRVAANEVLKKMDLSGDVPGAIGGKMSDIVSFEGKTTDTPLDIGKGRKKGAKGKGKEPPGGLYEVEQTLEFREVPADNLISFLDAIEQGKDLLFVTKLDIARKFNNMSNVRAVVTIATFQYQGEEAETPGSASEE